MKPFTNIHLVGAGGVGTILLEPLVRLVTYSQGVTPTVYIYDGDSYESSNQSRQLFDPQYLGANKAEALAQRISPLCDAIAYSVYVRKQTFHPYVHRATSADSAALIIPAVDSEAARHDIIKGLEQLPEHYDYTVVMPGNEYRTATCSWYARMDGVILPCHPFDMIENYANPTDHNIGDCGVEAVSSPQLINANFAAALMALETVFALVNDAPLPMFLNYSGEDWSMEKCGKLYQATVTQPKLVAA